MKYNFILVFFLFTLANVYTVADTQCVTCKKGKELFDLVNRKLDKMIANRGCGGGDGGPPPAPVCKPINFENLENATAKLAIDSIRLPYGLVADGNDVYVSSIADENVYRFNQVTNPGNDAAEVFPAPNIYPQLFDIKDGFLYTDTFEGYVYRKNLGIAGSNFEKIMRVHRATGIRWSPDGKQILLGIINKANKGTVEVYDENFQLVAQFLTDTNVRDISFDSDGNIRITDATNEISIFDKDTYKLMTNITLPDGVRAIDFTEHCDGTLILSDRNGKVLFFNKDYDLLKTVTVAEFGRLCDVAITDDGTLYVTDYNYNAARIYLYDLF